MMLHWALAAVLATATSLHALVIRDDDGSGAGYSLPDCGGLQRLETLSARMHPGFTLYRSSAPYYDEDDEDQRITPETIRCLDKHGILHVISLNSAAEDPAIRQALEQHGIAYTALPVPDFHEPTMDQLRDGWTGFRAHNGNTLVWCGYGHGRTGTMVTALQMFSQAERQEAPQWTRQQYREENNVERDSQMDRLDQLQTILRQEIRAGVLPMDVDLSTPSDSDVMEVDDTLDRVRDGDFTDVDCPAVLALALSLSLMSVSGRQYKRQIPVMGAAVSAQHSTREVADLGSCHHASEVLLRQECGVSDSSRPFAYWSESEGIRIFSRNADGNLIVKKWGKTGWWDFWVNVGGDIASEPVAISIAAGDMRVYARSKTNELMEAVYNHGKWKSWTSLGGDIVGAPSAIWLGESRGVRVYARNVKNELMEKGFIYGAWQPWKNLGGHIIDDPSAIWNEAQGNVRVYARNRAGRLMEKVYERYAWQDWRNLGGHMASSPSAISTDNGGIRVFARNGAGHLIAKSFEAGEWSPAWTNLGENLKGSPSAIWLGPHYGIRVYARGHIGQLMETGFERKEWKAWKSLGREECQGIPKGDDWV